MICSAARVAGWLVGCDIVYHILRLRPELRRCPGFPSIQSLTLSARWQVEESLIGAAFFNTLRAGS